MIYAVDFDNTLMIHNKPNMPLIGFLIQAKINRHRIILNTCRTGKRLKEAVIFCQRYGLIFDAINANLPDMIQKNGDTRKIMADFYIDDKAVNPFAIEKQ